MPRTTQRLFLTFAAAILGSAAFAHADEAGDKLKAQVTKAYKETTSYDASIKFSVSEKKGRRNMSQGMDIQVAFDRAANRLKIDRPDVLCSSDGEKLRLKHEQIPGKFLEIATPAKLTLNALNEAVPFFANSPLPDVAALLSDDPFTVLASGGVAGAVMPEVLGLPVDASDKEGLLGLQMKTKPGLVTIRIDPKSSLIRTLVIDVDMSQAGGNPGDTAQIRYDINVKSQNKPVAKEVFAFDASGGQSYPSILAMLDSNEEAATHPLVGKPAPPIELKDVDGKSVKISDVKADVIVIDLWATWCGPCVKGLPIFQSVSEWAKTNKLSVAFYTINLGDSVEKVREFLASNKLALPVLMDPEGKVGEAYMAESIPETVILAKGQIKNVLVGLAPDHESLLKREIQSALGVSAKAPTTAPAPK